MTELSAVLEKKKKTENANFNSDVLWGMMNAK